MWTLKLKHIRLLILWFLFYFSFSSFSLIENWIHMIKAAKNEEIYIVIIFYCYCLYISEKRVKSSCKIIIHFSPNYIIFFMSYDGILMRKILWRLFWILEIECLINRWILILKIFLLVWINFANGSQKFIIKVCVFAILCWIASFFLELRRKHFYLISILH